MKVFLRMRFTRPPRAWMIDCHDYYHDPPIGVAEDVLNKCTVNDPQYPNPDDENYTVAFNYEFIEDTSIEVNRYGKKFSMVTLALFFSQWTHYK